MTGDERELENLIRGAAGAAGADDFSFVVARGLPHNIPVVFAGIASGVAFSGFAIIGYGLSAIATHDMLKATIAELIRKRKQEKGLSLPLPLGVRPLEISEQQTRNMIDNAVARVRSRHQN